MIERLENPVFRQSSRQRMRGARTYGCLLAYLLILSLVVIISYEQFVSIATQRSTTGLAQTLFDTLTVTQWFLVAFITPALTTAAITMEREQRTIDLLMITPLSRFAIVWGKFASALAFVVVMILCGMPLVAVLFLMGGVDLTAVLERYVGMLVTGALLAAFGLMMSAICSTSTLANLVTYGSLGMLYVMGALVGTAVVMSRVFGGSAVSGFPFVGCLTAWQIWVFIAVLVVLAIGLLLQIAANYLLADPRMGAWKTRVLTALLYLCVLSALTVATRAGGAGVIGSNLMVALALTLLMPVGVAVATGVPMTGRKWYQWLYPRALGVGTVQSGLLFLWLLLAVAVVADQFLPVRIRSTSLSWYYAVGYLWWLWSLGYACSTLIRNRWGAGTALVGGLGVLAQFVTILVEPLGRRHLETLLNLATPAALFASGNAPRDMVLWANLYPVLGLLVSAGTAWIRHMGERRRQTEVNR